jgi:hypothetical protein
MAEQISTFTDSRREDSSRVIRHLAVPRSAAMTDEMITRRSSTEYNDFAEMRAASTEQRPPRYTGS